MRIGILNESFLSPHHLARLKKLGPVSVFENTDSEEKAIVRLAGLDVAIADCFIVPLNARVLSSSSLKFIALNSTGFDLVDLKAATRHKIKVANAPGFATEAVAEHALGLLLSVCRKIALSDSAVRRHPFQIDPNNPLHRRFLGIELRGKTLGIIGLGAIGSRFAEIGRALGMHVLAYNRSKKKRPNIKYVSLPVLLAASDVVSIHLPLTDDNTELISKSELALMKPTAILLNTARGRHVNSEALAKAIKGRRLGGAGLDVLDDFSKNNPLLGLDHVVLSPHSAFFTEEALANLAEIVTQNVESFARKKPVNLVN